MDRVRPKLVSDDIPKRDTLCGVVAVRQTITGI